MSKNLKNQNSELGNEIVHQESTCPDYNTKVNTTYTSTSTATGKELEYVESLSRPFDHTIILTPKAHIQIERIAESLKLYKKIVIGVLKLAYIVGEVTKHYKYYDNNGCKLNKKLLSKKMGTSNSEISMLIRSLCHEEFGVLKVIKGYKVGISSSKYILREEFCEDEVLLIDFANTTLSRSLLRYEAQNTYYNSNTQLYKSYLQYLTIQIPTHSPYHSLMMEDFSNNEVISTELYKAIRIDYHQFSLYQIINGNFRATRPDPLSRVHTNLTNLPKEFRQFLRCNGEPFWELDIRNSQPLIATIVFQDILNKQGITDLPSDLLLYKSDCENGLFYEYFMKLNDIEPTPEARSRFKTRFFTRVFFSPVRVPEPELCIQFKERYPTCYDIMCKIKGGVNSNTHRDFAIELQRAEAQIIFDEINVGLIKMGIPAYNIFDSILFLPEHHKIVLDIIKKAFNNKGLNQALNTNEYDSEFEQNQGLKCA